MFSESHLNSESHSKTIHMFLLLATLIIIGITIAFLFKKQSTLTQSSLVQEVVSIQQQLPIRIDAFTELSNVEVGEMEIKYIFLVYDNTSQPSVMNIEDGAFSKQVETSVKSNACRNKHTRRYLNSDVSLSYHYVNEDKVSIAEFMVPAGFCNT